ncbi:hypothetical protein M0D21_13810 [Aquimarina sp. D1M17]|uniref:DUF6503 family protein n=1 Tax=Aquimarina acroporae TaxID=2937283 RepID=UPI0020BDD4DB|nr:DUF6503 family protein [Aquimarina acroporae]MCK8522655.1 hypothetical protein [Aquimarina acroporae]
MKQIFTLGLLSLLISCGQTKKETPSTDNTQTKEEAIPVEPNGGIGDGATSIVDAYIKNIETAHKKDAFLNHKVVSFYANIYFGGKQHLEGKITMLTNSTKIRIDKKDNSKLIYTGEKVFLCPEDAKEAGARFDMFTWTYFFGFPYKLSDPGTKWELGNMRPLDEKDHQTAKLTFEKGIGDAPDDWYVVYTDPENNTMQAAAYIVTFGSGGDTSKAEADPHAIHYKDFIMVDGIPFATKWDFYGWTEEKGMTDKLGEATISDITFLDEEGVIFNTPENAKEISLQ